MENFLSPDQFQSLLNIKIFVSVCITYLMYKFAVRNPTDFDTPYRKKIRLVNGWIYIAFALGFIVLACAGPLEFSKNFYYLSLYGTLTPSETALQYGISPNMLIRSPYEHCIWGRQTLEQWYLGTSIFDAISFLTLGIYLIAMKPSSVKFGVKVRKVIGYLLLILFPIRVDSLHYFDAHEIIPILIYALITYFLVRTYKKDAKLPEKPKESEDTNIESFVTINPEEKVILASENNKQCFNWHFNCNNKLRILILTILCCIFAILSVILMFVWDDNKDSYNFGHFNSSIWIDGDNYSSRYFTPTKSFFCYEQWSTADGHKKDGKFSGDKNTNLLYTLLGKPIKEHGDRRIYWTILNERYFSHSQKDIWTTYFKSHIVAYKLSKLGYNDKEQFLNSTKELKNGERHNDPHNGEDYILFIEKKDIPEKFYAKNEAVKVTQEIYFVHHVYCVGNKAFDYIWEILDQDLIDQTYLRPIYFKNPNKMHWLLPTIFASLGIFIILFCTLLWYITNVIKEKCKSNKHARNTAFYSITTIVLSIVASIIILLCSIKLEYPGDNYVWSFLCFLNVIVVQFPTLIYLIHKGKKTYSSEYLVPNWVMNSIMKYSNNMASLRAFVIFILYPGIYLATLPLGFFAYGYIIPVFLIFYLCLYIKWIIDGGKIKIYDNVEK